MLFLIRNAPTNASERSFFALFSTLVSNIVDADVSDLVAFTLSSGSIIGLNKDDELIQEQRKEQGLKPENARLLLLKLAFDLALHSPPAQEAAKELRPIQQGLGAPRGMEMIAHVQYSLR
jgi:hypothetical protein